MFSCLFDTTIMSLSVYKIFFLKRESLIRTSSDLTHYGRMMNTLAQVNWFMIYLGIGLSSVRRHAITWTNDHERWLIFNGAKRGSNVAQNTKTCSLTKMRLKMPFAKCRIFCSDHSVFVELWLTNDICPCGGIFTAKYILGIINWWLTLDDLSLTNGTLQCDKNGIALWVHSLGFLIMSK